MSKIKIAGHPVHPMLISFPIAFYTAALVCYIVFNVKDDPFWFKVALLANGAGVLTAGLAAIPGFIDWLFISSGTKAKKTGLLHMFCNVGALALYGINLWMVCDQWNAKAPDMGYAIPLTAAGFLLTLIAGFLGWKLVQKHHVGVDQIPT
jgi:uncharacterized membrane protein